MRKYKKIISQTSRLELNKKIINIRIYTAFGTTKCQFSQKHKKEGKFQLTNTAVQLNYQVLEEFHPPIGYR